MFRISIQPEGNLLVSGIDPTDDSERALLTQIIADLEEEFELSRLNYEHREPDLNLIKVQWRIRRIARQEERIALLLHYMLTYPTSAASLFQNHRPRAAFERRALALVATELGELTRPDGQAAGAHLFEIFYSICFPMNRGVLLEYFAKHLSKFPAVKKAIESRLGRTNSMFIHRRFGEIMKHLRNER
jgi:hypothetical protein